MHGKDGRDGSNVDATRYIPYIGADRDVDLGHHELYSDGIHVNGFTESAPVGSGLTLAYFSDDFWWPLPKH